MQLSDSVIGAGTAATLRERAKTHLLTIGNDHFTRRDFAKVDCFSFLAAQNLSHWLNKVLKVDNTRYVYFHVPPTDLAIPHLGPFSLAVLGAAFELKNLGGDAPLESWLKHHQLQVRTFHTIKMNELMDGRTERKALKTRKESRRDKAHGHRVERFLKRA